MEWFFIGVLLVLLISLLVFVEGPEPRPRKALGGYRRGYGLDGQ